MTPLVVALRLDDCAVCLQIISQDETMRRHNASQVQGNHASDGNRIRLGSSSYPDLEQCGLAAHVFLRGNQKSRDEKEGRWGTPNRKVAVSLLNQGAAIIAAVSGKVIWR